MKNVVQVFTLISLLGSCAMSAGNEIGFVEDFVLATDRQEVLKQLVPGTDEHFYFSCLYHHANNNFGAVDKLLNDWTRQNGDADLIAMIRHRQALLRYPDDNSKSLAYLKRHLNLRFDHQKKQLNPNPKLPTELDEGLLERRHLDANARRDRKGLSGFTDQALQRLAAGKLSGLERRELLSRLREPDVENLPQLVVADLKHKGSRGFGSLKIHSRLFLSQMDKCKELLPELRNQKTFVQAYLLRLQPGSDEEWRYGAPVRQEYLQRLERYVNELGEQHLSLKAMVLYHRLLHDQRLGKYDKRRFLSYLKLPRQVFYVNRQYVRDRGNRFVVDLAYSCEPTTGLSPIGNDEPLVRDYLAHFLRKASNTGEFAPYIDANYLKYLFAETKLVNGIGDPQRWFAMLPPSQLQALRERVDIEFAATNPSLFQAKDDVALDVTVKNVKTLIVKIFEINAESYYRANQSEVGTDIDLDGLVPNHELSYEYDEEPLLRTKRRFELPQLKDAGTYVVDFVGNGISSRVVIRKGRHRFVQRTGPDGQEFTIFDDDNQQVRDARLWMAGHEYEADRDGTILVPFSTAPRRQPFVISQGGFSTLHHFDHQAEGYKLQAAIHLDRESLLMHQEANVIVRARLLLNGAPIALGTMENPRLRIVATDLDGTNSSHEIPEIELHDDRESTVPFHVAPRITKLAFTLSGTVKSLSTGKAVPLVATAAYNINAIDQLEHIGDLHLANTLNGYVIELRGKSGEPMPQRAVNVELQHREYSQPVRVLLKSDQRGKVRLGPLASIVSVAATTAAAPPRRWQLVRDRHSSVPVVQAAEGEEVRIPWMELEPEDLHELVSLFELRGSQFLRNRLSDLKIQDGFLVLKGLAAGDYRLFFKKASKDIRISITKGQRKHGYLLGGRRHLEASDLGPLQILEVAANDQEMSIQLANVNPQTRVHVFATKYVLEHDVFHALEQLRGRSPRMTVWPPRPTQYVVGRDIGDEQRYIIERRFAQKYPGNVLNRPGLLLNPWAARATTTSVQTAAPGSAFEPSQDMDEAMESEGKRAANRTQAQIANSANLDFLAMPSGIVLNLRPDKDGRVTIDTKELGPQQHLHVVAVDRESTVYRSICRRESEAALNDLRLTEPLDPNKHYTRQRQVTVLQPGDSLTIEDVTASRFEYYDSLAQLYRLYSNVCKDARIREFAFLANWPELTDLEKREKYSEYACHELHFFLSRKDPDFFNEVVVDYIANKRDKTFLDRWLLDHSLESYRLPWQHSQLNIAERILLGLAVPDERAHALRHIREIQSLSPQSPANRTMYFSLAVSGKALEGDPEVSTRVWEKLSEKRERYSKRALGLVPESANAEQWEELSRKRRTVDRGLEQEMAGEAILEDSLEGFAGRDWRGRTAQPARRLYRQVESTQEWLENNYFRLTAAEQNAELIEVSEFWSDFARHDGKSPFLSSDFAAASRNLTEALLGLALMDLPFAASKHEKEYDKSRLTLKAASPLVIFHEQIRDADAPVNDSTMLVNQSFYRHGDRYRIVNGVKIDKPVKDEFTIHTVYDCQVVVSNTSSSQQRIQLLLQVPEGAVPVLGSKVTDTIELDLPAFQTKVLQYHFYFPLPGQFKHFPVNVARGDQVLAHAMPVAFNVVESPTNIDVESWAHVSQYGSDQDVLDFLKTANLQEIDLSQMAFRMKDATFFDRATELLGQSHAYDDVVWSYAIYHNRPQAVREYLQHQNSFLHQLGGYLDSPLLNLDPVVRRSYQHRDYRPLINARVHRLGRRRTILNDRFYDQYHQLLDALALKADLGADDRLALTYYLLLQDRVSAAIEFFSQIDVSETDSRLQYDYLSAYIDCYQDNPETARLLAKKYANHPVDRWRKAFEGVQSLLDQVDGREPGQIDDGNQDEQQRQLADSDPRLEFDIESAAIRLDYANLAEATVNYYLMDLELLFSRNPFAQQFSTRFQSIRPNKSERIKLPKDKQRIEFQVPQDFDNRNILVEVTGGGQTANQPYYANSLDVHLVANYGRLRVKHEATGEPLSAVYVKTYAELSDGSVVFHKDGYTDLRGIFDYASISTGDLASVSRFAVFVSSEEHGAMVQEAKPPKR